MQTAAVDAAAAVTRSTSDRGVDSLKSEDFFRILVTELQQQDPLKPTETADMLGQVSDIRNIEVSKELTDVLAQIAQQQGTIGASEMLGKFVTATMVARDGNVYESSGIVTGVRFDANGSVVLELDTGEMVLAAQVTHIMSPETAESLSAAQQGDESEVEGDESETGEKSAQTAKGRSDSLLSWLLPEAWLR